MRNRLFVCLLAAVALSSGAALAQDPVAVAPANHKVTLDNDRVRTYEITLKPGAEVAMHSHPEHVIHVVAGGTIRSTDAEGKSNDKTYAAGQTVAAPAMAHSVKNVGKSTIRAVVTELKDAATSASLTSGERAEILEIYRRSTQELLELVSSTPDELWSKPPAPGRWSVAATVEHIALAEPMIFGMVQGALAAPADPNWALVEGGRSTDQFMGMLTNRDQKFQAPEPLQPTGTWSRADALAKYGAARAVTAEFVRRLNGDVKKHVAASPVGKMTVHQALVLIGGHNLRHNAQIRETLGQLQAK